MAPKNIVLKSINIEDESRCVDIFIRHDGTFGFEEFRRDIEDARGWFPVGFYGDQVFDSEQLALDEAVTAIVWLKTEMLDGDR